MISSTKMCTTDFSTTEYSYANIMYAWREKTQFQFYGKSVCLCIPAIDADAKEGIFDVVKKIYPQKCNGYRQCSFHFM